MKKPLLKLIFTFVLSKTHERKIYDSDDKISKFFSWKNLVLIFVFKLSYLLLFRNLFSVFFCCNFMRCSHSLFDFLRSLLSLQEINMKLTSNLILVNYKVLPQVLIAIAGEVFTQTQIYKGSWKWSNSFSLTFQQTADLFFMGSA